MVEIFNQKISTLSAAANSFLLPRNEYLTIINRLEQLSNDKSIRKEQKDYKQKVRYEILEVTVEGQKCRKLVKKGTQLRFVTKEDLFDTIEKVHLECGHGGPRKMHAKMVDLYANVTLQQITAYVELCERCQFVALKTLESKRAEDVADRLIDIFCESGSPVLLQSNNGKEFVNEKWPTTKVIHGHPRHSQSQNLVELCNHEVPKMLACWKADNKSNHWADGLRFVQWEYNSRIHNAIRRSPYEAVFGRRPGLGLNQVELLDEVAEKVNNEKQLEEVIRAAENEKEEKEKEASVMEIVTGEERN